MHSLSKHDQLMILYDGNIDTDYQTISSDAKGQRVLMGSCSLAL